MAKTTVKTPEIESWEDRSGDGNPEHAFGYVYFDDGSRVGYTVGLTDTPDVWEPRTNGGGQYKPVTIEQLEAAGKFLQEQGIPVKTRQAEV